MPILEKQSGSAFYKKGPLFQKTEEEAQAQAESQAQSNASENLKNSERVYGETTRSKTTEDGVTTYTARTPYTTSATGKGEGEYDNKVMPKGWKATEAQTAASNKRRAEAKKSKKGVVTRSFKSVDSESMPLVPMSAEPTANVDIPKNIPQRTPELTKIEGTKSKKVQIKKPKPRVNYKKAGSGGCSCS
jgi:hypothetical protein